ncbi:MAG: SIR2 family protein, partial [Isosphaeraceae bacterium]|nr:SIR2 family protein [Isosphaeraceae bacterium]
MGRPIVPLLGAGISVDSGYPATGTIVRYLAKVRYYLDQGLYLPTEGGEPERDHPLYYPKDQHLSLFGWPDPFQLNDDLWNTTSGGPEAMEEIVNGIYLEELKRESPTDQKRLDVIHTMLVRAQLPELRWFFKSWRGRQELPEKLQKEILEFRLSPVTRPNWRPFLRWVTDGRADHVDTLFHMLNRGRDPGNSHRFLAFLSRHLGWKLILTTNFDDLIERAMRVEGLNPVVFDVWREAELPNGLLVSYTLSVVKLHGSAYGLRVGESLDDPLSEAEKMKLMSYMPENTLLLVLGYGGQDRRIMDLVTAVLESAKKEGRKGPHVIWVHFEPTCPTSVEELVKRFDGSLETHTGAAPSGESRSIVTARTHDPGAFLVGLYSQLTHVHPASAATYSAHLQRPIGLTCEFFLSGVAATAEPPAPIDIWEEPAPRRPVHIFTGTASGADAPGCDDYFADCSTIAMSEFLSEQASTHTPIWIDAAMFQSIEEMVSEIIRQCRKHDPTLPPVILALGGTDGSKGRDAELSKIVSRVHAILRRGSYIVAIEDIEAFGRPPTTHHGLPQSCAEHVKGKVVELCRFLTDFVARAYDCKDSYICLAINELNDRFSAGRELTDNESARTFRAIAHQIRLFREELERTSVESETLISVHRTSSRRRQPTAEEQAIVAARHAELRGVLGGRMEDLVALVSTFRRPRSIVALRKLALPYFPRAETDISVISPTTKLYRQVDSWLACLEECGDVICLEGGLYWVASVTRDRVYDESSALATSKTLLDALGAPEVAYRFLGHAFGGGPVNVTPDLLGEMSRQLARLTLQHREIARYYYSDLFLVSKDISAYSEYLYHRVSSIRYATKLAALVTRHWDTLRSLGLKPDAGRPDPVGAFVASLLDSPARDHVLRNRFDDILALKGTLERDRDTLLSLVPFDTLLGWISWIIQHDLARFLVDYYGVDVGTGSAERSVEKQIHAEILSFRRMLQALRCKVLYEKTDYEGCISARIEQLRDLIEDRPLPRHTRPVADSPDEDVVGWLQGVFHGPVTRLCAEALDPEARARALEALEALANIGSCFKGLDKLDSAGRVILWLRELVRSVKEDRELRGELAEYGESLELDLHLGAVALILAPVSFWANKNDDRRARAVFKLECNRALAECDAGLRLVRETNTEPRDYFVRRSYVRTYQARALALRGRFVAAFQDFDRAMAGLDPRVGADRAAMAARTLFLAEALTFFSDQQILNQCNRTLDRVGEASCVSPHGLFFLGFDAFVQDLAPGSELSSGPARQLLRRALTPWADLLSTCPERARSCARTCLNMIEAIDPNSADMVGRVRPVLEGDLGKAWRAIPAPEPKEIKEALQRSLGYWDTERLSSIGSGETADALRTASRALERARDALEQAEAMLIGGRRAVHSWG